MGGKEMGSEGRVSQKFSSNVTVGVVRLGLAQGSNELSLASNE